MQQTLVYFQLLLICLHTLIFFRARTQCSKKHKSFTVEPWLFCTGSFVWADVLVFSPFWICVSLLAIFLNSWLFFLVVISVFWLVRSAGEVLYWFLEQFTGHQRNKAHDLIGYNLVKSEAIYFVYQIFWQCILVLTIITTSVLLYWWLPLLMASFVN